MSTLHRVIVTAYWPGAGLRGEVTPADVRRAAGLSVVRYAVTTGGGTQGRARRTDVISTAEGYV